MAFTPRNFHKLMKNGKKLSKTPIMRHSSSGDGTYQTWVSVELDSQNGDIYSCHVEHGGHSHGSSGFQGKAGAVASWVVRLRKGRSRNCDHCVLWNRSVKSEVLQLLVPGPFIPKNYWGPQSIFVYVSYIYFYLLLLQIKHFFKKVNTENIAFYLLSEWWCHLIVWPQEIIYQPMWEMEIKKKGEVGNHDLDLIDSLIGSWGHLGIQTLILWEQLFLFQIILHTAVKKL